MILKFYDYDVKLQLFSPAYRIFLLQILSLLLHLPMNSNKNPG